MTRIKSVEWNVLKCMVLATTTYEFEHNPFDYLRYSTAALKEVKYAWDENLIDNDTYYDVTLNIQKSIDRVYREALSK